MPFGVELSRLTTVSGNGSQVSAGAVTTIRLLMLTGCRKSEIMTLRWQHVDLDKAEIRIVNGKTGDRTVHLSPSAVGVLAALPRQRGNPWVVPGAKPGTHMADIDGAWQSIRTKAGLHDVRIHDIRHSYAIQPDIKNQKRLLVSCLQYILNDVFGPANQSQLLAVIA